VTAYTWAKYIPNGAMVRLGENSLGGKT